MDLPTYTNIWRIEKRLYKLYDLRLPMPLPIVWIGVFVGVLAPWSLLLYLVGLPFGAPWHVVYLVPPGVVTWLSTRPVIESKRLTELLQSQMRYMGEPRTWCRMAPAYEPSEITLTGRVWQATPQSAASARARVSRKARHAQSKRVAVASAREVRPAVAAAAAAATAAPVTGERIAWGTVARPRKGTAPALGQAVSPETFPAVLPIVPAISVSSLQGTAVSPAMPAERNFLPPAPAAQFKVPADPVPAIPASPREQVPAVSFEAASAASASPHEQVPVVSVEAASMREKAPAESASPREQVPAVPVEAVSAREKTPAASASPGEQAPAASVVPAASAASDAPVAPIGTEALKRLRRLAASAGAERGVPAMPDQPSPAAVTPAQVPDPRPSRTPSHGPVETPAAARISDPAEVPAPTKIPVQAQAQAQSQPQDQTQAQAQAQDQTQAQAQGPVQAQAQNQAQAQPETQAQRQAQAQGQGQAQGPVQAQPRTPAQLRGQAPKRASAGQAPERPAIVPDPVERPSAPAVPSIVPRFVGPAPIGLRASEQGRPPAETDESAWAQHRKGQPVGKPAETSKVWPSERSTGMPANMSIRAVPSASAAKADPVTPSVPVPRPGHEETGVRRHEEPRVRRVESVVGRDSSGGWRRLAQVVIGPGGGGRTDGSEIDEARARAVFSGSRRVVVLGCTGGAGQTTTALMLAHTFARYREDRVLAVDANIGTHALSSRIQVESPETLSSLLTGLDNVHGYLGMRAYTSRCASGLEVLAGDADAGAEQRLSDRSLFSDRRLGQTMDMLDRHYKLMVMDPAAALAARVLPYADQLVLVVPASEDGPDAVAMTYEWLDGHGCADLRQRAIMVVNGVSRRSMGDVEQAEAVARGRCRAIVRVPWEDELAPGRSDRVEPSHLRTPGRRAYLALAGVVVAGFGAVQTARPSEEELAQ
ncbi:TcpE family conjugal transfer membrane protein [Streptosporangium sp. 'caverna']|uniref:TcpE family conjugal transfer membrane protein n=1 Tax=Streptosporangium sp. 'caverna' TaxID=2202249 RepID=UPI000D7D4ED6|nr:TcpE family conjugal transfer membrane protein [Streptosporangium sp. 'caverna']AWS46744.1 hypothetical protein DKM19_41035 [Streptosporangium sp. 'caverna']